jgi:ATP phosphoribosyltransferase regulatory subunit
LKTNRILEVVSKRPIEEPRRILVTYTASAREAAFRKAKELREQEHGLMVETRLVAEGNSGVSKADGSAYQQVFEFGQRSI